MRSESYPAESLVKLFRTQTIATLPELKKTLGTNTDMTVFRKLKGIGYRTSYSHRGKYYALEEAMEFDVLGLWACESVRFSRHGTLLDTACSLVSEAEAGYFTAELEDLLDVGVKEALLRLFRQGRVSRERVSGLYLYASPDAVVRRHQLMSRKLRSREGGVVPGFVGKEAVPDELKAAIVLFVSMLDEKQRRLYAGLESLKLGHGGDRKIAELTHMGVHTVARGRRELLNEEADTARVRTKGGGRKGVEKKRQK